MTEQLNWTGSLGWALSNDPYEKRSGRRQAQREDHMKIQEGDHHLQAKGRGPPKKANPWPWTSRLQNCEEISFYCSSPAASATLLWPKTKTRKLIHRELWETLEKVTIERTHNLKSYWYLEKDHTIGEMKCCRQISLSLEFYALII